MDLLKSLSQVNAYKIPNHAYNCSIVFNLWIHNAHYNFECGTDVAGGLHGICTYARTGLLISEINFVKTSCLKE